MSGISYLGYKYFVKTKKPSGDDLTEFLLDDLTEFLLDDLGELDKNLFDDLEKIKKSLLDYLKKPTENSPNEGYTRFEKIIKYLELTDEAFEKEISSLISSTKGLKAMENTDSSHPYLQKTLRILLYKEAVLEKLKCSEKPRERKMFIWLKSSSTADRTLKKTITASLNKKSTSYIIQGLKKPYDEYVSWAETRIALALGTAAIVLGIGIGVGLKVLTKRQTKIPMYKLSRESYENYCSTSNSDKCDAYKMVSMSDALKACQP